MESKKPIGSAAQVTAAAPGVYKVASAPGLYLRRTATGGSWAFRYRAGAVEGVKKDGSVGLIEKKREMGLGSAIGPGAVTLAEARKKAIDYKRQIDDGADPLAAQERARVEADAKAREEARKVPSLKRPTPTSTNTRPVGNIGMRAPTGTIQLSDMPTQ